jgi:hypothetical protein
MPNNSLRIVFLAFIVVLSQAAMLWSLRILVGSVQMLSLYQIMAEDEILYTSETITFLTQQALMIHSSFFLMNPTEYIHFASK